MTTQQPEPEPPPAWGAGRVAPVPARRNGYAFAAVVLGAIGVPLGLFVIGGVLGVMAVTLGVLALGRVRRGETGGRAMAWAGIGLGVVAVLAAALTLFVIHALDHVDDPARDCFRHARTPVDLDACRDVFGQDPGD